MGLSVSSGSHRVRPQICCGSIAPVAARWNDSDECVEVELDNGLECLSSGTVTQAVGQRIMPGDILGQRPSGARHPAEGLAYDRRAADAAHDGLRWFGVGWRLVTGQAVRVANRDAPAADAGGEP